MIPVLRESTCFLETSIHALDQLEMLLVSRLDLSLCQSQQRLKSFKNLLELFNGTAICLLCDVFQTPRARANMISTQNPRFHRDRPRPSVWQPSF